MRKNGFSLLELLVVVAIIIVLASVAIVNFSEVRGQLALKRAAHQLMQDIRKAQEMAMSSLSLEEAENCSSPFPPAKGYGVYIDRLESNKSYKLYADTSTASTDCETYPPTECWEYYDAADCVVQTITIQETGVFIANILNTAGGVQKMSANFKPPNPTIKIKWLSLVMDEVEIVLALESDQTKTRSVVINKAGLLQVR